MGRKMARKNWHFQLVKIWFVIDALIALAPPLYWLADKHKILSVFGLPVTLCYFLLVGFLITASILYAYWVEIGRGTFA
jgi:hypothetical protein